MVTKIFAREDVADVHLDHRHRDRRNRVADRDRGVGISARIDDDAGGLAGGGPVDQIDDLALVVRLAELDRELVAPRGLAAKLLYVLERRAAIGLRLARAEEIEVGAVEDVDGFRHGRSCRRDRGSVPLYRDPARKGEAEARERHDTPRRARPRAQLAFTRRAAAWRPVVEA